VDAEKAHQEIEKLAKEVLANPVIEDYRVEVGE
ncbi:MAG: phosphoribosylformylglycinamidine synthase subunit PurS, partial [Blastocatellia bacterium]|nr:phosphoribosylformylglycinamidine synthase subunit PurS [Blastocatellia bacterium]